MPAHTSRRAVVLLAVVVAVAQPRAARGQERGHMPESVPGKLVRELLAFSPLGMFPTDSSPPELYLEPVPSEAIPLELPSGLRPAASLRSTLGRVLFFPRETAGDSLVPLLARHLYALGWRRDDTNLRPMRALRAGEGLYCRRHSSVLLVGDTTSDGYVMLTRLAPMVSACERPRVDSTGRAAAFFPTIDPPARSNGASSGTSSSGIEQAWHVDVAIETSVEEVAAHYVAALERDGLRFGPVVMRGDTLTRTVRWVRDETTWTGELRAMMFGGRRRVAVNLRRELDPDERY